MDDASKCPVMHGSATNNKGLSTSNKDWWPNQLNINILHQHDNRSNPMSKEFNYRDEFKKLERAGAVIKGATSSSITGWILDWPFVLLFLVALVFINWTAAIITAIFMFIMMIMTVQRVNLRLQQDSTANLEIFLTGLLTIVIISVGSTQIIAGTLDIGLLIGSNILASRALQGANRYAKAKEALGKRDRATAEIISFIKQ